MAGLEKIRAGVIGGAGYTGGETIRILINHPQAELEFVHSKSNAGNPLYKVHTDLLGDTDLKFTGQLSEDIDVLFLCLGHGDSRRFLEEHAVPDHIRIIDLSQDFRLKANASSGSREFVYGLPELNREKIRTAKNIANPGCFATGIQLALLPLASRGLMKSDIHINATTGSTGAGQGLSATSHFSWRNNNLSVYKAFGHQHLGEIGESLVQLQQDFCAPVHFIPQRGDYTRGILSALYLDSALSHAEATDLYMEYYRQHPFTHVSEKNTDLKQVVNTNKCFIYLEKHENQLFVVSVIDNLLKGASGQAVQNMNLMFGLEETAGLRLKAAAF
jgi:N-acetyl-gamma-glutamyl-phosphate reductase